jgi:hypothetical protein
MDLLGQYLKQIQEYGYGSPVGVGLAKTRWDELTKDKKKDKPTRLLNKDNVPLPYSRGVKEAGVTSGWRTTVKRTELDFKRYEKMRDIEKKNKKRVPHDDNVSTMSDIISASNPNPTI